MANTKDKNYPAWVRNDLERDYYDHEWGMPIPDEAGVLERVCLEGFQAGLSWYTVLAKRPAFRELFADFMPEELASFTDADVERLMQDQRIIRNRLKIRAAISNAQLTLDLRQRAANGDSEFAGFYLPTGDWVEPGLPAFIWSYLPQNTILPRPLNDLPTQSDISIAMAKDFKKLGGKFLGPTSAYALMSALGMVDAHLVDSHRRGCSGLFTDSGELRGHTKTSQ